MWTGQLDRGADDQAVIKGTWKSETQTGTFEAHWGNLPTELKLELGWTYREPVEVRNAIFVPFTYKNDHCAKTGSGQT